MRELGVLGNSQYKLVCMLDHKAMLTVQTEKYGVFDCKPLQFIWAKVGHIGMSCCLMRLVREHNSTAREALGKPLCGEQTCLGFVNFAAALPQHRVLPRWLLTLYDHHHWCLCHSFEHACLSAADVHGVQTACSSMSTPRTTQ